MKKFKEHVLVISFFILVASFLAMTIYLIAGCYLQFVKAFILFLISFFFMGLSYDIPDKYNKNTNHR